jgi:ribose 1,5-bisphosphokinase PhnN
MSGTLIVIYGPPLAGKTTLAWALARTFPTKTAVVSSDQLRAGAIAVPDPDAIAELALVHVQLRLLVANYLKNGYDVVVEGAYLFEVGGERRSLETEVDQLLALMRHLAPKRVAVRLTAPAAELRQRALATGRDAESEAAVRLSEAYGPRVGPGSLTFDSAAQRPSEIAAAITTALAGA